MKNINWYMDKAKKENSFKSDLQLARALNFKGNAVNYWRQNKSWPSDEKMSELAKLAKIEEHIALADLNYWRSPKALKSTYKKMRDAVAMLGVTLGFLALTATSAQAGTLQELPNLNITDNIYYHITILS